MYFLLEYSKYAKQDYMIYYSIFPVNSYSVCTQELSGKGEPPGMIIAIHQIIKTWRLKMEFNTGALQPNAEQFAGLLMRELRTTPGRKPRGQDTRDGHPSGIARTRTANAGHDIIASGWSCGAKAGM